MKKTMLLLTILMTIILGISINAMSLVPTITPIPITIVPTAPTGLGQPSAFSHAGPNSVSLVWGDNSSNETGFRIEAKNFNTFSWYTLANVGANVSEYQLTGLTPSTNYLIRVVAYNSFGSSTPSNEYAFTTDSKITITYPNGGTLTAGNTYNIKWDIEGDHTGTLGGDVAVSLCYNTDGSDYYKYIINHTTVMAESGSYSWVVPNIKTNSLKIMILFSHAGNPFPTTVSDSNDSLITVLNPLVQLVPLKPSNLSAKPISSSEIELKWDQSGTDKMGFKIYRKSGSLGTYTEIATVDKNTYKLLDKNLKAGTTYSYQVYAYNTFGKSVASNTASATTNLIPLVIIPMNLSPQAPKDLTAEIIGITQINLNWTKVDNYATGYSLERKKGTGIGVFTEIADLSSSITDYSDSGVILANTYQYRVRAYNIFGHSNYSNIITITMPTLDIMPFLPELFEPIIPTTTEEDPGTDGYPSASDWAKPEIDQAVVYGLTTDHILNNFQQSITREEFCEIVVKLYEASSGETALPINPNPFSDTSNPEILKAYRLGIVNGVSADTFAPNKNISRQEICVMLLRELKSVNPGQDYSASSTSPFADENSIASWAIDAVRYMNQETIMNGVGGNKINPLGNTTREQAIALLLRTYERFGL